MAGNFLDAPPATEVTHTKPTTIGAPSSGVVFEAEHFQSGNYTYALQFRRGSGPHSGIQMDDCYVNGAKDGLNPTDKWGSHARMVMSGRARRVYATARKEHGFYWGIPGGFRFTECTVEAGAQAWQITYRHDEDWFPGYDPFDMGDIVWTRCWARECGRPEGGGRASFAWALYRPRGHSILQNCRATHGPKAANMGGGHVRGLIQTGDEATLELHGGTWDYLEPDTPFMKFDGAGLHITRANIARGVLEITPNFSGPLLVKGNTGAAEVKMPDGERIPITQTINTTI